MASKEQSLQVRLRHALPAVKRGVVPQRANTLCPCRSVPMLLCPLNCLLHEYLHRCSRHRTRMLPALCFLLFFFLTRLLRTVAELCLLSHSRYGSHILPARTIRILAMT